MVRGREKGESVRKEIKEKNIEARLLWDEEMNYLLVIMCGISSAGQVGRVLMLGKFNLKLSDI